MEPGKDLKSVPEMSPTDLQQLVLYDHIADMLLEHTSAFRKSLSDLKSSANRLSC